MKHEAFLIFKIDARTPLDADVSPWSPPRIVGAQIIGEPSATATLLWTKGITYCDAFRSGEYDDYDDAKKYVRDYINMMGWDWCFEFLNEEEA